MKKAQAAQRRLEELERDEAAKAARATVQKQTAAPAGVDIEPGLRVRVMPLGKDGKVLSVEGKTALVEIGALHTRAKLQDLVPLGKVGAKSESKEPPPRGARTAGVIEHPDVRCDVRGMRAEEAMHIIEQFLDRAYLHGPSQVILVHGHGAGVLKQMVRDGLEKSPYVERFRPGDKHEGGDGVTVVDLRS